MEHSLISNHFIKTIETLIYLVANVPAGTVRISVY